MKVLAGPWRSWDGPGGDSSVTIGVLATLHKAHVTLGDDGEMCGRRLLALRVDEGSDQQNDWCDDQAGSSNEPTEMTRVREEFGHKAPFPAPCDDLTSGQDRGASG